MKVNIVSALAVLLAITWGGVNVTEATAQTSITTCQDIMVSGSYKVTAPLNHDGMNPANGCLLIDADNVTIDVNGFPITGSNSDTGIATIGSQTGIMIKNGTVRDFDNGIDLNSDDCRVEGMTVISNDIDGMRLNSPCLVNNNIINDNGDNGIEATSNSSLSNNIVNDNVVNGIQVSCPSNLIGNTAQNNGTNLNQNGAGCKRYNNLF